MNTTHKHLIIGAGPVGLAHAQALKEHGIPYDHVDASDNLGGNWHHGVYETAHIISSKKVTEYANYPMPEHYPDFPSRQNLVDYFHDYADYFGLRDAIEFHTKVVYIRPIEQNQWEVTLESGEQRVYKGVLVCNGHHWHKELPEFEGHFNGEIIHSKDYKRPDQLAGKRVIVIGAGNSACDVVSEAARVSETAYMSIRTPTWFFPKTMFGVPLTDMIPLWMPVAAQKQMLKGLLQVVVGDMTKYGLQPPAHEIFERHPTVSTEMLHYVKHGRITPKPMIRCLEGDQVEFTDGTRVSADLIVCATGFKVSYPFLPTELQRIKGKTVQVYGGSALHDYRGLYLIGWSQPRGGVGSLVTPASHMVARTIKLQKELDVPMGLVLKESGEKLPDTHLMDPADVLRRLTRAERMWPVLSLNAKRLSRKRGPIDNETLPPPAQERLAKPMQVF